MRTVKQYLLIIVATLSFVFMPAAANAQYVQLYCNNDGTVGGGQFYYANQANGQGACQFQGIKHIFSQILCNFVVILNNVLGQVYCGIQAAMVPILEVVLTLYVAVFGVQILMGTSHLNTRDIIMRLIKIAAVWTFATESTWGINYIFQFFLAAATQGSMWVINSINASNPTGMPVTDTSGNYMSMYSYLDTLIYGFIQLFTGANEKVLGFFVAIMVIFPTIFGMMASWVMMTIGLLGRTLLDSLLCLSGFAFLSALSPIFLSCMLFEPTAHFFEEWLKHMTSYALQLVIVFAIVALWIAALSIFGGFFNELANLIYPKQLVQEVNTTQPVDTFGICQYIMSYAPPGNPTQNCVSGLPCMPSLRCDPSVAINNSSVIDPSVLLSDQNFIFFMTYNLMALMIIAYAFGALLKNAPTIAAELSSAGQVSALTSGFGLNGLGQFANLGGGGGRGAGGGSGSSIKGFLENAAKMFQRPTPR